jgi:hypothetical protein
MKRPNESSNKPSKFKVDHMHTQRVSTATKNVKQLETELAEAKRSITRSTNGPLLIADFDERHSDWMRQNIQQLVNDPLYSLCQLEHQQWLNARHRKSPPPYQPASIDLVPPESYEEIRTEWQPQSFIPKKEVIIQPKDLSDYVFHFMKFINLQREEEEKRLQKMTETNKNTWKSSTSFRFITNKDDVKENLNVVMTNMNFELEAIVVLSEKKIVDIVLIDPKISIKKEIFPSTGWTIDYVFNDTDYKRKKTAINAMNPNPDDDYNIDLAPFILGSEDLNYSYSVNPDVNLASPLGERNLSQQSAIQKAINSNITIIQGPFGTGKSATSASIVSLFVQLLSDEHSKVLVCGPSNNCVDHLALTIT